VRESGVEDVRDVLSYYRQFQDPVGAFRSVRMDPHTGTVIIDVFICLALIPIRIGMTWMLIAIRIRFHNTACGSI
jgi:hypothetical protein